MVLTFFLASGIDEASKRPMDIIRKLPSSVWNVELDRFVEQLRFETNALSAKRFFHMTRSVILGLAGTVVTYELLMLQLDTNVEQKEEINICD
jgi:acyl-ACP thioesterase